VKFEEYFSRQIRLWGEETQRALQQKRIAIIGCGGLGSSLALALGGSGIGEIDLVDFDTVSLHNIHRQIALTLADEGRPKAEVVAKAVRARNPFVQVEPRVSDFETFAQQDRRYDLILDATDNAPVRRQIDVWAKEQGIPWLYGSVEAFNGQVCLFEKAAWSPMAPSDHTPAGVAAPMVMHVASLQANLALRYLAGLPVQKETLSYLYVDDAGVLRTQTFAMPVAKETK
jgi:adenylyltransferase/sulfurtransferase